MDSLNIACVSELNKENGTDHYLHVAILFLETVGKGTRKSTHYPEGSRLLGSRHPPFQNPRGEKPVAWKASGFGCEGDTEADCPLG